MSKFIRKEPIVLFAAMCLTLLGSLIYPELRYIFAIEPRSLPGLVGVLLSPLMHGGLLHLISNALPFLTLGLFIGVYGTRIYWAVTAWIWLVGGLATWVLGAGSYIIGASGIVFGYWSFLIVYGFRKKSIKSVVISIFTVALYGSLFLSFFRFIPGVSWMAHICGAAAGILMAILMTPAAKIRLPSDRETYRVY